MRWHEVTGETLPANSIRSKPAGDVELQVVRTVPEKIYAAVPRGDSSRIAESSVRAFRQAQRFIYVENQFLWSPQIASVLKEKLTDPPSEDFKSRVRPPVET